MKKYLLLLLLLCGTFSAVFAAKGHNIQIKLENYPSKQLILGFYYGDKPYVKDTFDIGPDGYFSFKADTLLPCGVYLLVLIPDNSFIQFAVPADDQEFILATDAKLAVDKMKVSGSDDNAVFFDYLRALNKARMDSDTLRAQMDRYKNSAPDSIRISGQMLEIDKQVKKLQQDILQKHPQSLSAKIVRASIEPEPPEFKGDDKALFNQRREWARVHYFDHVDITDLCMLRSPVLHPRMLQYVNDFTVQHPDSIIQSIEFVLNKVKGSPDVTEFYLNFFLSTYASSKFVGMDAVYVHLAKNYFCKGLTPWVAKENLQKICDDAARLEPTLIGKIAPNIVVKDRQNKPAALWDVDADYTVLFFWAPDCSHCKKAAPDMVKFAENFKDRGVKVFALCTAKGEKAEADCWKSVEERGFSDFLFLNHTDPFMQSRYGSLYDIRTTPQILILDRKHEILMKKIDSTQLNDVMDAIIRMKQEKNNTNH